MAILKNWWIFGLAIIAIGSVTWISQPAKPNSDLPIETVTFPKIGRMVEVTFDDHIMLDGLADVPIGSFVLDQSYNPARIDDHDIPPIDYYQLADGDLLIMTRADNNFLQILRYSSQSQQVELEASLDWQIAQDLGAVFMDEDTVVLYGSRYGVLPSTSSTMTTIANSNRWDWVLAKWDFNNQLEPEVVYANQGGSITSGLKTNRRADKWFAERADSQTVIIQAETINGTKGSYLATAYMCDIDSVSCAELNTAAYHFPKYHSAMYITERSLSACSYAATDDHGKIWYATPDGIYRFSAVDSVEEQIIGETIYPELLYFLSSKSNQCVSPAQDNLAYEFDISTERLTKIDQPIWGDLKPRELFWTNWSAEPPYINGNQVTYIEQDGEAILKGKTWLANAPWTTWIKTTNDQILFIGGWRWAAFIPNL